MKEKMALHKAYLLIFLACYFSDSNAFCRLTFLACSRNVPTNRFFATADNDEDFSKDLNRRMDEIQVNKARKSLEDQNTRSFLKRRPVKLKYEDARRWVQANLGADTQEEYEDLVANGNLRTPYIPKQPEQYYTSTKEWISWEHYLTGIFDKENPSSLTRPITPAVE